MLNFDKDFKNFMPDGGMGLEAIFQNRKNLENLGIDADNREDTVFGAEFVYCGAHMTAHSSGWCTVRLALKRPLHAQTETEAKAEVAKLGYPTFIR